MLSVWLEHCLNSSAEANFSKKWWQYWRALAPLSRDITVTFPPHYFDNCFESSQNRDWIRNQRHLYHHIKSSKFARCNGLSLSWSRDEPATDSANPILEITVIFFPLDGFNDWANDHVKWHAKVKVFK
jgi:hypothetical protein